MKGKILLVMSFMLLSVFIASNNVYANTEFNVNRKSMKIYDKFDLSTIITTDSNNIKYTSSDEDVATVSQDGIVFAKKQGQVTINVEDENSSDSCILSAGFYVGMDISSHNELVDWNKVKNDGLDFIMIRAAYGWYDDVEDAAQAYEFQFDKQFLNNIKGASENNISFGIYHYSYATNVKEAELEAEYILNAINSYASAYKKNMTLPIAYDVEDKVIKENNLSKEQVTENIIAFCNKIFEAGYTPIVYSNTTYFRDYIDILKLNDLAYKFWYAWWPNIPDYDDKVTIKDTNISPFIWQYTDEGYVEGATNSDGYTCLDVMYMKDRVKIEVLVDGQVVDIIGADKGYAIEKLPTVSKKGYKLLRFEDSKGTTINDKYTFDSDSQINAIFERIKITALSLDKTELNIDELGVYQLNVGSVLPQDAIINSDEVVFESDNENIAKVDNSGRISIVDNGTCNITCYLASDRNIKSTCRVNINVTFKKGDMNRDGIVDPIDASIALDKYKYSDASKKDLEIGDMDNNNIIDPIDASMILDIYKGV